MIRPKVQIDQLENTEWLPGASCTYDLSAADHIWRVSISAVAHLIHQFWGLLSADERERAGRYHREKDRERFIVGRSVLRILSGRYLDQDSLYIVFEAGQNHKPYIKGADALHHNLSHSGDIVLIAFSKAPVGIDAEQHDKHLHYQDIMQICYDQAEIEMVERSATHTEDFYLLWTRKEAFLKMLGKGIDDDLKLIPSLNGIHEIPAGIAGLQNNTYISSFNIQPGYSGSIASSFATYTFWDMDEISLRQLF